MSSNDWNASLYTDRHAFVWQSAGDLVDLLDPKAGERILDVGCGTGQLTDTIAKRGAAVVGVDASPSMIEEARRLHPQIPFEVADVRSMTFEKSFDAVFSNAALHWVPEADRAAGRIARSLRPGGRFVAEFGGHGNVDIVIDAIYFAANKLNRVYSKESFPWYFPSIAEYGRVLERAGLEVRYATLFDRPTKLQGADGLRNWIRMFGAMFLARLPIEQHEEFFVLAETRARPKLFRDNAWYADYRRLRVVAQSA